MTAVKYETMHDLMETEMGVRSGGRKESRPTTAIVREERIALGGREIHGDGHDRRERERRREKEERARYSPNPGVILSARFSCDELLPFSLRDLGTIFIRNIRVFSSLTHLPSALLPPTPPSLPSLS